MAAVVSTASSPTKLSTFRPAHDSSCPDDGDSLFIQDSSNDPGTSSDVDSSSNDYKTPEPPISGRCDEASLSDAETIANPLLNGKVDEGSSSLHTENNEMEDLSSRSVPNVDGLQNPLEVATKASTVRTEPPQVKTAWEALELFQDEVITEEEQAFTEDCRQKWGDVRTKEFYCTACNEQFRALSKTTVFAHPVLKVLLCVRCRTFYGEGQFTRDEDGLDEYCRWCANGGNLLCCDFCANAICKQCLQRNLNRKYVKEAERVGAKWKCCVCDSKPLWHDRAECRLVVRHLISIQRKRSTPKGRISSRTCSSSSVAMPALNKTDLNDHLSKARHAFATFEEIYKKLDNVEDLADASKQFRVSVRRLVDNVKQVERVILRRQSRFKRHLRSRSESVSMTVEKEAGTTKTDDDVASNSTSIPSTSVLESQSILPSTQTIQPIVVTPDDVSVQDASSPFSASQPQEERLSDAETFVEESCPEQQEEANNIIRPISPEILIPIVETAKPASLKERKKLSALSQPKLKRSLEDTIKSTESSAEPTLPSQSPSMRSNSSMSKDETQPTASGKKSPSPPPPVVAKGDESLSENEKARKALLVLSSEEEQTQSESEERADSPPLFDSDSDDELLKTRPEAAVSIKNSTALPVALQDSKLHTRCLVKEEKLAETLMNELETSGCVLVPDQETVKKPPPIKEGRSKEAELDRSVLRLVDMSHLLAKSTRKEDVDSDTESIPVRVKRFTKRKSKQDRKLLPLVLGDADSESDKENEDSAPNPSDEDMRNGTAHAEVVTANEIARQELLESSEEDAGFEDTEPGAVDSEDKKSEDEKVEKDSKEAEQENDNNGGEEGQESQEEEDHGSASSPMGEDADVGAGKGKKNSCSLLNVRLGDWDTSDDDDESSKKRKKEGKKEPEEAAEDEMEEPSKKKMKKKKILFDSDSDFEPGDGPSKLKKRKSPPASPSSSASDDDEEDDEKGKSKPKRRRRIKQVTDDEEGDGDDSDVQLIQESQDTAGKGGRKNIKRIIKDTKLTDQTRAAAREEQERRKRISGRQKMYNVSFSGPDALTDARIDKIVLDFDPKTKEELVTVHPDLVPKLKPHQVQGIKFMWEACFESLERLKTHPGSGCILAHCMGLGKTLQVVALTHTVMTHEACDVKRVLVICPLVTVLNWVNEFGQWLRDELELDVYELASAKQNYMRQDKINAWFRRGGIMVIGYEMYRNLTNEKAKRIKAKARTQFQQALVDPGPDLVICDEGHLLKNQNSAVSKAVNRIRTTKRIVLTGTPLQNNLKEYHCMVDFVKPKLLGTQREFQNRFVNPISNGQCADSTDYDVRIMKNRAHVLHNLLEGCVQRYDYSVLTPFLPPKHEYVISVKLSDLQAKLYTHYLENCARGGPGMGKGSGLFPDFQALARVWTHPFAMKLAQIRAENKPMNYSSDSDGSIVDFIDDHSEDDADDIVCLDDEEHGSGVKPVDWKVRTRRGRGDLPPPEDELKTAKVINHSVWWSSMVEEEDMTNMSMSGKLVILMDILRQCELIGDKILVFSQSIVSLDLIEEFLAIENQQNEELSLSQGERNFLGSWKRDVDYFRFDGSTAAELRKTWVNAFNRESNHRARLFLISTRAGGLGINLTSANRVIIFDASWNPSHDIQSIFRIYRFGQTKPCYVYRFLAQGTMEEKIYNRQVTKQSLSCRVVDEQQIDRHFKASDLADLYKFEPLSQEDRPVPNVPKDRLLAELTIRQKEWIVSFHEHDSLLQNKEGEGLTEEERKAAWEEYENEKKGIIKNMQNSVGLAGMVPNLQSHLVHIAKTLTEQNPGISQEDLQIRLGRYVEQLQAMNVLPFGQTNMANSVPSSSGAAPPGAGGALQDQAATAQMVAERTRAMYNMMLASQMSNFGGAAGGNNIPTPARRGRPPLPPAQSNYYPQFSNNFPMQRFADMVGAQSAPTQPAPAPEVRSGAASSTAAQPKPGSSKQAK